MKEAYAVRRTVPPSAEIEAQIDRLLAVGVGEHPREALTELAKLGARLIIQRAVEEEFDAWLGRARYRRRPEAPPGLRNGYRLRRLQTAEGELEVEIPQVRQAAEPFVSALFPRGTELLRTEPLKATVIGAFVRGLSMRDVESLCEQAGLGKLSKPTAARICSELRERFEAFQRDLYEIHLAALFLDATFLAVRPTGKRSIRPSTARRQAAPAGPRRRARRRRLHRGRALSRRHSRRVGRAPALPDPTATYRGWRNRAERWRSGYRPPLEPWERNQRAIYAAEVAGEPLSREQTVAMLLSGGPGSEADRSPGS
jgi:mutator family transposase